MVDWVLNTPLVSNCRTIALNWYSTWKYLSSPKTFVNVFFYIKSLNFAFAFLIYLHYIVFVNFIHPSDTINATTNVHVEHSKSKVEARLNYLQCFFLNPLNASPTKWSNTLKQFVGCCRRIV